MYVLLSRQGELIAASEDKSKLIELTDGEYVVDDTRTSVQGSTHHHTHSFGRWGDSPDYTPFGPKYELKFVRVV